MIELLTAIADAQTPDNPRHITIVYAKLKDNQTEIYRIAPTNVRYSRNGNPLLVAYKHDGDIRTFRIDNIKGYKLT